MKDIELIKEFVELESGRATKAGFRLTQLMNERDELRAERDRLTALVAAKDKWLRKIAEDKYVPYYAAQLARKALALTAEAKPDGPAVAPDHS